MLGLKPRLGNSRNSPSNHWNVTMLGRLFLSLGFLVSQFTIAEASGICSAPRAPYFYQTKPLKPAKPFCIDEILKKHTCDNYTIDQYNSEVESYNSQLLAYKSASELFVMELNDYLKKAKEYAQCEVDAL